MSSDLLLPDHQTGEQRAESTFVNALNESRSDTTCSSGEHLRLKPHFYHHSDSGRPVSLWLLNQRGPDHWQLSHQPQQKEVKSEKRAFLPQFFSQFQFFSISLLFCSWTRRRPGEQNQLRVETFLSPGWKNLNEHQLWSRRQAEHQRRTSLRERFSSLVLFYQSFCLLYLYLLSSQPSIVLRCLPVSLCRSLLFIFLI